MSKHIYQRTGRHIPNTAHLNTHFLAVKNSKFTHEYNPGFPKLFFKMHLYSHLRLYLPREIFHQVLGSKFCKRFLCQTSAYNALSNKRTLGFNVALRKTRREQQQADALTMGLRRQSITITINCQSVLKYWTTCTFEHINFYPNPSFVRRIRTFVYNCRTNISSYRTVAL